MDGGGGGGGGEGHLLLDRDYYTFVLVDDNAKTKEFRFYL